jgi:hypothetical protein
LPGSKPHYYRRLNKEARSDIQAWMIFVESFNGKCLCLSDRWETSEQLNLNTDASNIGFGVLFRKHWFAIKWPTDWLKYHITIRELFPIVVAIQLWGNILYLIQSCGMSIEFTIGSGSINGDSSLNF